MKYGAPRVRCTRCRECGKSLEEMVFVPALVASDQLTNELRNIRQLDRSLHQGVTREYLLDQGRTGARQPHDEYRNGRDRDRRNPAGRKKFRAELALGPAHETAVLVRAVRMMESVLRVAGRVVGERALVRPLVLERLAEREFEMQTILLGEIGAIERRPHGAGILRRESKGFQVGEAPIGLAESRLHLDGATIRGHALFGSARRLQSVRETHPHLGLLRMVAQHLAVEVDRPPVVAEIREYGRLEAQIAWIAGVLGQ